MKSVLVLACVRQGYSEPSVSVLINHFTVASRLGMVAKPCSVSGSLEFGHFFPRWGLVDENVP